MSLISLVQLHIHHVQVIQHVLKQTILFGMLSMLPYLAYMMALYLLVDRWRLGRAIGGAVLCWALAAVLLIVAWEQFVV